MEVRQQLGSIYAYASLFLILSLSSSTLFFSIKHNLLIEAICLVIVDGREVNWDTHTHTHKLSFLSSKKNSLLLLLTSYAHKQADTTPPQKRNREKHKNNTNSKNHTGVAEADQKRLCRLHHTHIQ